MWLSRSSGIVEDSSLAPLIIGVGLTLQLITATLVSARIFARMRDGRRLQLHDWAVLVAETISIPQLVLIISATTYGYGRHQVFVSPASVPLAMRSVFIAQVLFSFSVTASKLAIAFLLLHLLRGSKHWRRFLYGMVAIICSALIPITLLQFLACRPFSAYWDPKDRLAATCWSVRAISANVVVFGCIQALADITFSFVPLTFIVHLQRPLGDRIAIGVLMGLGVFASATAIARTALGVAAKPDPFRNDATVSLLALVDLHVGIAAATVPTLKSVFERFLGKIGDAARSENGERETRKVLVELGLLDTMYDTIEFTKSCK